MNQLTESAISLLQDLIRRPSFSKTEDKTADIIENFLKNHQIECTRQGNNVIARNKSFVKGKKTIVLNSHHDTVKVVEGWTRDPFGAEVDGDVLYGLGSNDAGASLVSLMATFIHYYDKSLPWNLLLIASAEEENFGSGGVTSVLSALEFIPDLGIIGEPTGMKMAIAEKGLIVIDGIARGVSGHVAHQRGENAIYKAMRDVEWIKNYRFPKKSETLGEVMMSVTQIEGGLQHNIIPDLCKYVVDVRVTECYTLQETFDIIQSHCEAEVKARSLKWHPSSIAFDHTVVQKGMGMGLPYFGSATLSDQVHFMCPTIKIGPGDSLRSHTADEHILLREIRDGIKTYIALLDGLHL